MVLGAAAVRQGGLDHLLPGRVHQQHPVFSTTSIYLAVFVNYIIGLLLLSVMYDLVIVHCIVKYM